jgi:hypothetical protein
MTENTNTHVGAPEGVPEWTPKVRREGAMLALGVDREQLFSLKLRRRKMGNTTFYDPEQIVALMHLRDHWRRTASR